MQQLTLAISLHREGVTLLNLQVDLVTVAAAWHWTPATCACSGTNQTRSILVGSCENLRKSKSGQ